MRYPNLRYGNPTEFAYYVMCHGNDIHRVARLLRRDPRTVRDWLSARARIPWWVPEIMRLKQMEGAEIQRQMNMTRLAPTLGLVRADVIQLAAVAPRPKKKPQTIPGLRLDDFSPIVAIS
jgi:hypothetical protein